MWDSLNHSKSERDFCRDNHLSDVYSPLFLHLLSSFFFSFFFLSLSPPPRLFLPLSLPNPISLVRSKRCEQCEI